MYAPLQVKSGYSLLQSPSSVSQIVKTAKARGYQAVSLAEQNVLYSLVDFYKEAKAADLKPIFSLQLMVNGLVNLATPFPVLLSAYNETGYRNLILLSSKKMTLEDEPMTMKMLADHLAGLVLTLTPESELGQLIASSDPASKNYLAQLDKQIGQGQERYLGINPSLSFVQQKALTEYSNEHDLPLIAWDRVDYMDPEDAFTTQVLRAVNAGTVLDNLGPLSHEKGAFYLKDQAELFQAYQQTLALKEAYENNEALVSKASVELTFKKPALPVFEQHSGLSSKDYLQQLAYAGLKRRLALAGISQPKAYEERLTRELTAIIDLGFADYFLIVWDILKFARDHKVQTGAGRGSAAGSLVAYCLGITNVDPLQAGLLFERFLNPERAQMPDIDIDWPDDRRDELLSYLHDKYGQDDFAQIITFGTLAAKQVLRDVGRVFGLDAKEQKQLTDTIPAGKNGRKVSLDDTLSDPKNRLEPALKKHEHGSLLLKTARKMENLPRNYSTHAAGVVLSDSPLTDTLPVQKGNDGYLMTQLPKGPVEALGLLKIDILGLTTLKILAKGIELARPVLGDDFDIKKISFEDQKTLALFAAGQTNGVFQFESAGMQRMLRRLKIDRFALITASTALYRPGPSQHIETFIKRRLGQEPVPVTDPVVDRILAETFGILVYQEQVMQVAEAYAGFTLAQADFLRSAMSKKKLKQMAQAKEAFLAGAKKKGHSEQEAEQLFTYIDQFANYGFNKSHAVAYSELSFSLAYLKAHAPLAFYTALLNAHQGGAAKAQGYLQEAKKRQVKVLGPDINQSQADWSIDGQALQMGIGNIAGLPTPFVEELLAIRNQTGGFIGLPAFVLSLPEKWRREKEISLLINAGALDRFGYNRAELTENLQDLLTAAAFGEQVLKETKMKKVEDYGLVERLQREKDVLGFNLSGHPTEAFSADYEASKASHIADLSENQQVTVYGLIKQVKVIKTKKGDQMAFLSVSDMTGSLDVTVFPKLYERLFDQLKIGKVFSISGKTEVRQGLSLIANRMTAVNPDEGNQARQQGELLNENEKRVKKGQPAAKKAVGQGTWFLRLIDDDREAKQKTAIWQLMQQHPGNNPVTLYWPNTKKRKNLPIQYGLADKSVVLAPLQAILGDQNVVFKEKG
ncbi:DNA polymerase III subunit alpha [Fructobacillus sp. M1-13]|uniref:DNA polymerase III subunit alpha n=1 Tax=Fructobacillus papyriferae TaxID=2713171 RepID=A0ABS5QQE6_9LACO|nr:DNA polymerase III subunit alpha [Fructobacillus papyriferae]MBS9334715.1 DNA polymerase III subunit alpha [Fructobacillus papyriferae]MCD2158705.1 DNA polymerase III subunit alpha [Fructobacillus papyriferae]